MKAIVIQDADSKALVDALELEKFKATESDMLGPPNATPENRRAIADSMHRRFHYVVVRWLQERGADLRR